MQEPSLVVGLGNPGAEYTGTRHNAGFLLVEQLAARWKAGWQVTERLNARLALARGPEGRRILCQPMTFMNSSGEAVGAVTAYYRIQPDRLMIVVDDADLPLGEIRLRGAGGTGGHHGLESVEQHVGTKQYARLRMGIGRRAEDARRITGHVLGRFDGGELALFERVLERGADQVECWLSEGLQKAMNKFNGLIEPLERKG